MRIQGLCKGLRKGCTVFSSSGSRRCERKVCHEPTVGGTGRHGASRTCDVSTCTFLAFRTGDLDDAVLDRMDEALEFGLPGVDERRKWVVGERVCLMHPCRVCRSHAVSMPSA